MKNSLLIAILSAGFLPAMGSTQHRFNIDVNAGTQGAGISVGYHVTPSVRLRLRGATLSYSSSESWSDSDAQLKLYGNNVGLLVDVFPGEGNFYLSAGLNFSESKMRCRARLYREPGMVALAEVGGVEYEVLRGDYADITGKYSWNHVQPYVGLGYQDSLFGCDSLYFSVDLGVNFMGNGDLSVGSTGYLRYKDKADGVFKPATKDVLEKSIRKEGRDFFKIADDLCVYPVLQVAIGARF